MNILTVEKLHKSFGNKILFDDITFGINEGDKIGIIGVNGTGKSTLLKIIQQEEILIENTETRDQPKNKENAMRQLRSILYDKELQHRLQEQAKIEAGKMKIEWGSQIRSYVFDDRRVKDHRTNYQTSDVGGVMDGDLDAFIKAYLMEFAATEE